MKKIMILAIVMLSGTTLMAQTETKGVNNTNTCATEGRISKEIAHKEAVEALNRRDFVLQAHGMASTKNEDVAEVNPTINFLAVKGDKGLLQMAPPADKDNSTPIAGLTMKMDILSCDVKTDKRGNVTCLLSAMLDGTEKQFKIKLNKKNSKAVAEYEGSPFAFIGELLPGEVSTIHIGEDKV